jgi:hypothetical protein
VTRIRTDERNLTNREGGNNVKFFTLIFRIPNIVPSSIRISTIIKLYYVSIVTNSLLMYTDVKHFLQELNINISIFLVYSLEKAKYEESSRSFHI